MTGIQLMSDQMVRFIIEGYLAGKLTITKPDKPLKANKEGSLMEQIFFEFESRKL